VTTADAPAYSQAPPQINAGAAFTELIKAPGGWGAIAIGGLLYLLFPLIIPWLMAKGWLVHYGRAVAAGRQELPPWKFGYISEGARIWFAKFLYSLPVLAIGLPFFIGFIATVAASEAAGEEPDPQTVFAFMGGYFLFIAVSALYTFAYAAIKPAVDGVFVADNRVSSCVRPSRLKAIIRPHGASYLLAPVLVYALGLVAGFGFILCIVGIAFTTFYLAVIEFHFAGQLARSMPREGGSGGIAAA
jgi:uncharacterized protein DUF4013